MPTQKKPQYVLNEAGKRIAVTLDLKTYEKLLDDLDDYYCQKAYDEAKPLTDAEIARGEFVTIEELKTKMKSRLRRQAG